MIGVHFRNVKLAEGNRYCFPDFIKWD